MVRNPKSTMASASSILEALSQIAAWGGGGRREVPLLAKELLVTNDVWERESQVFQGCGS